MTTPSDQAASATESVTRSASRSSLALRLLTLAGLAAVFGVGLWLLGDQLSLDNLAAREAGFRQFQLEHPLLLYVLAFAAYVLVTGLSIPGATAMTLLLAWLFGFWRGLLLVSFASTLGASFAFLLSRYLLRDAIQRRFSSRLAAFNEALRREGAFYLFTLRLIPAVPFFVINIVMGLTPMRLATFWWVSQVGMFPATVVYVFAGSSVPSLQILAERGLGGILRTELLAVFVLLGLYPLIVKRLFVRFRPHAPSAGNDAPPAGRESATPGAANNSAT
jgi:uncharacterized membrane protein YdjX (TVP38/TMEM64 family)